MDGCAVAAAAAGGGEMTVKEGRTFREELKEEDGVEVCRIVSRRVTLEFTRIIPEPEGDDEGSMITELYEGDLVVIVRQRQEEK
jgi:hypothetical protein